MASPRLVPSVGLVGTRIGRLTVISEKFSVAGRAHVRVRCDCGNELPIRFASLVSPRKKGFCSIRCSKTTHGHSGGYRGKHSPEYSSWASMVQRCENVASRIYPDYGAKGIRVCVRWLVFANFLSDMGPRPPGTSIDRIDNERGYEPGNCKWSTRKEQNSNRRSSVLLELRGETATVTEWSRRTGIPRPTIVRRIRVLGWAVDRALSVLP